MLSGIRPPATPFLISVLFYNPFQWPQHAKEGRGCDGASRPPPPLKKLKGARCRGAQAAASPHLIPNEAGAAAIWERSGHPSGLSLGSIHGIHLTSATQPGACGVRDPERRVGISGRGWRRS